MKLKRFISNLLITAASNVHVCIQFAWTNLINLVAAVWSSEYINMKLKARDKWKWNQLVYDNNELTTFVCSFHEKIHISVQLVYSIIRVKNNSTNFSNPYFSGPTVSVFKFKKSVSTRNSKLVCLIS